MQKFLAVGVPCVQGIRAYITQSLGPTVHTYSFTVQVDSDKPQVPCLKDDKTLNRK